MVTTNLFEKSSSRSIISSKGKYSVIEYLRDISVNPEVAQIAYFASEMNVRKRQVLVDLNDSGIYVQAGEMQIMAGNIEANTGIKGPGDFLKKVVGSAVTDETAIKSYYYGTGQLLLEPTFNHVILVDLAEWNDGIVIEDGMYLANDDTVEIGVTSRKSVSSVVFGGEGLFNTTLTGSGIVVLESPVPEDELIVANLDDDTIKIDGNMAIAWSPSLNFTVQKTTKTLVGSAISGEGFVNVYEGTGRVLIAPVRSNRGINYPQK